MGSSNCSVIGYKSDATRTRMDEDQAIVELDKRIDMQRVNELKKIYTWKVVDEKSDVKEEL